MLLNLDEELFGHGLIASKRTIEGRICIQLLLLSLLWHVTL